MCDRITSVLMQQFYHNLANKNRPTKAEALRQAQLSLLRSNSGTPESNYSHPYYWSPFILIGNGL